MSKITFKDVKTVEVPPKFQSFLLADYSYGNTRLLSFCSQEAKEKLIVLKNIFGDGTFKSCPPPFQQLYTFHGDLGRNNHIGSKAHL